MKKKRRYTAEEKIDCVKRHTRDGETKHEISRRTGIPRRNIISWIQKYEEKVKEQTYPVTLHTDQGSVYSSRAFQEAHAYCTNIIRSMSRVATPTDNPIIESINGWVKAELYKDFGLYTTKDIHKLIDEYIYYFNNCRYSTKCGRKSPVQFRIEQGFS